MVLWEYFTAPLPIHNSTAALNNFGSDGWELVTIVQNDQGGLVAFMKRPSAAG